MGLTKADNIKAWLEESVDTEYLKSRYRLAQKAFDPAGDAVDLPTSDSANIFPDFPELRAVYREKGVTNMIEQAQLVTMARLLRAVPEPEFPDVDEYVNAVRKGVWSARVKGYGTNTDGFVQLQKGWLDGTGLGMGYVQIGLKTGKEGFRRATFKHVPIFQMIYDGYVRSFCDARMACSMTYVPMRDAIAMFGLKKAMEHEHSLVVPGDSGQVRKVVRVFEYYDLGYGDGDPTMAYILGDITNEPFKIRENPFNCLPFGYYEHFLPTGMPKPKGLIDLLVNDQDGINEVERSVRSESRRPGFDIVSEDLLDEEGLAQIKAGKHGAIVPTTRPLEQGDVLFQRITGAEVSQTAFAYLQMLKDSFRANAGVSEMEQGQDVEGADTLGEVQLVDQRSKTQGNWVAFQTARYFQRIVDVWVKVVALGDDEPTQIDVMGTNVEVNNGDPRMALSEWFSEPSDVVVSEEELLKGDVEKERANKIARLREMAEGVQAGAYDPITYFEEKAKALGYDPKKWLIMYQQEGSMMAPPMQVPGQVPGQEQQAQQPQRAI